MDCVFSKIRVVPLAAESYGVRSMSTYVETHDVRVLLDAGVSLSSNRFGFPPHPREYKALAECRRKIARAAENADVITLSHYHFDHHTPSYEDWCNHWSSEETARKIYEGKTVLMKNHRHMINHNQRRRGWMFTKTGGKCAKTLKIADGRVFMFGETKLKFSDPVFHGSKDTELGWVLMVTIEVENETVMFAPDVQGPSYTPTLKRILTEEPQLAIIGGPPLYLSGFRVQEEQVQQGMNNLMEAVSKIPVTVLDHHILRDEGWRKSLQPIYDAASKVGHKVVTAAEFTGKENNLLEFRRRQLFEREPPSSEFKRWMKLIHSKKRRTKPPLN